METEQRHLQMLLTVSSFGESLRRDTAEAFLNLTDAYLEPCQAIFWGLTGDLT